jgi:hypothetical protein
MGEIIGSQRGRSRITVVFTALWVMAVTTLQPVLDYRPSIIFNLALKVIPSMAILLLLSGAIMVAAIVAICLLLVGNWRAGLFWAAFISLGGLGYIAGGLGGGPVAVFLLGEKMQAAMGRFQHADEGVSMETDTVTATPVAAFYVTDNFMSVINGLAYDSTGQLPEMIKLDPEDRPKAWQDQMPPGLRCQGQARPVWGNYYKVTIWLEDCWNWNSL